MDIKQAITILGPQVTATLSRRTALQHFARRDIAAVVLALVAAPPLSVMAQADVGGQCCMHSSERGDPTPLLRVGAPVCTPAVRGMRLLEVTVASCDHCPAYPA
jgi:hypothetical protein